MVESEGEIIPFAFFYPLTQKATIFETWMNPWRVPYEAHTSVVGYASEGSACMLNHTPARKHGLQPVGLHSEITEGSGIALR
jgi:hypothetical protein